MPKLSFKRKSADETASLSAYLPTQMVDYTSLPPIEEETARTRFGRMPLVARLAALLLPLLLLVAAGWGVAEYFAPAPAPAAAQVLPQPELAMVEAKVVSGSAIALEAHFNNLPDGATGTAQLLANGAPIAWAAAEESTGAVQSGKLSLRLSRPQSERAALDPAAAYTVKLTVGEGDAALVGETQLEVPPTLRNVFFAVPAPSASPAPEPTPSPTPEPTPEPAPEPTPEPGPPTLEVTLQSTALISPTLGTSAVLSVDKGQTFEPLFRSVDNTWFLVASGDEVGWLHKDAIAIGADASAQVPLITPDAAAVAAGPNKAAVGNGGNIRFRPNMDRGTVLGQLHAGQTITLKSQTADGQWFRVVAPEAEGWVSVTLLEIADGVIAQVPVAK